MIAGFRQCKYLIGKVFKPFSIFEYIQIYIQHIHCYTASYIDVSTVQYKLGVTVHRCLQNKALIVPDGLQHAYIGRLKPSTPQTHPEHDRSYNVHLTFRYIRTIAIIARSSDDRHAIEHRAALVRGRRKLYFKISRENSHRKFRMCLGAIKQRITANRGRRQRGGRGGGSCSLALLRLLLDPMSS